MIDKMYIMLKEFQKEPVNIKKFTKEVLESYKKKHSKTEFNKAKDVITTWIQELNKDGKITSKYENHYKPLQRAIEKIWNTRNTSYGGSFVEKTVGNLGKENISTRNNKIFDIQWAVLTNEDTMNKMFNPGSFDVQKKTAAIIKAAKAGVAKSYKELSEMKLKELEALSTSNTGNIIFSTTQVAFHKQNMTAGKLIGIFANNNTSHAFLSMQRIHLNIPKEVSFTIDGHTVSSEENNLLDALDGFDGSLISKNIAGFLAASVDAVKDPVLNFMNLNTFTAGPAMLLARLGFDSDTIGLLLTQPIIEKVTREYFKQNNDGYVSVEDVITQELDTHGRWDLYEKQIKNTDFDKETLLQGISEGIINSEDQLRALLLFKRLAGISKNLNTLTFLTKFNSVSNAVGPTIADTFVMRERYNKFLQLMESENPPFTQNAVYVIKNSPILQAFYSSTVGDGGASELIFSPYFPHYSNSVTILIDRMRETTKAQLDAKTINKLINDFIFYKLTVGDTPIINTNKEQRNRFINNFTKEFITRTGDITDNVLLSMINIASSNNKCPVPTLVTKISGANIDLQEKVKTAWSDLVDNPDTFELGRDLFIYNLFRSGFNYSPKTFLHLASVDTKLAMGRYIDAVANINFNDSKVNLSEFLLMFRRNHAGETKIVPELNLKSNEDTKISADTNRKKQTVLTIYFNKKQKGLDSIISIKNKTSIIFSPVITYNDKLFYTEDYNKRHKDSITYTEISPLGIANDFLEYNANESAIDMTSVVGRNTKKYKAENQKMTRESEDKGNVSRSDNEVNYNKEDRTLTDEGLVFYFTGESPLAKYQKELLDTANTEGLEAANARALQLIEQYVSDPNSSENVKKKFIKELDKFCR